MTSTSPEDDEESSDPATRADRFIGTADEVTITRDGAP